MTFPERSKAGRLSGRGLRLPRFHPSEVFLLAALTLFGTIFALTIPLGAGADEETHQMRVWELAHFRFIPNEVSRNELPYPAIYWNLSYRRQLLVHPVESGFWAQYGYSPIDAQGYIYAGPPTRSLYSPLALMPYALVLRYLGLKLQLSALVVFYASRLAGLATYVLLAWLALRVAPYGKWLLAVIALTPTAVYQAATIGADPVSNGAALLFIAGCLAVSTHQQVGWRAMGGLIALSFILFWGKGNYALLALLPLLILSPSRFRIRGGYFILVAAMLTLALVEVVGWSALAYARLISGGGEFSATAQAARLIKYPLASLVTILSDLGANGLRYLREWVAIYGYGYGVVPFPTYFLFAAGVVAAWWGDPPFHPPSTRTSGGLVLTFLVCVLGTSISLYLAATPVGARFIEGLQGRYYTLAAPLLGLALVGAVKRRPSRRASSLAIGTLTASLACFGLGIFLSYHVLCGPSYYQPGLCYLPLYKNWAPNDRYSSPISPSETMTQEIVSECNGISEMRVWVDSAGLPPDGETMFTVRDPVADRDLAQETVTNGELPQGGWFALGFNPAWDSEGRLYLLRIGPTQTTGPQGARIALTLQPEYLAGRLVENQAPVDTDVVFQYGCAAGLGRVFPALRIPDDLGD